MPCFARRMRGAAGLKGVFFGRGNLTGIRIVRGISRFVSYRVVSARFSNGDQSPLSVFSAEHIPTTVAVVLSDVLVQQSSVAEAAR